MAFHVACPITCQRICFCTLGFPQQLQQDKAREGFLDEVFRVEDFLRDNWIFKVRQSSTIQVAVPRVKPPPPTPVVAPDGAVADTEEALLSAQTKRAALQRKAAAALVAAEEFARQFEAGNLADASRDFSGDDQGPSMNVMCRLCFSGENEGSERARRMLSCKSCSKKYHRNCLKIWSQNRDLFHWSSWACPSCRICEVCRRTGDPNKFMFCKRCDAAYHCYCHHPPHKNVSSGPYLCEKHTRCHSCGSNVPGNGLSTRWFLGYMCCDACGRLFVKGNYCPVCLKVYRDSESTPMVCCDFCQRWVHCRCDGISDEKYLQYQVDDNLHYKCATCRGECYQVKDIENAVRELWRRRDEADKDLIASLRATAGFPTQEEIFSISPYSDDEDNGPVTLKDDCPRSLKFSLKGLVDKSPKKVKESGKKLSSKKNVKKKSYQASLVTKAKSSSLGDEKTDELMSHRSEKLNVFSPHVSGNLSHIEGICSINQPGVLRHKFVDEIVENSEVKHPRVVKIKSSKPRSLSAVKNTGMQAGKSKVMKGTKLVIHLGAQNKNVTTSPRSDGSSCQREEDLTTSNGKIDSSLQSSGSNQGGRQGNMIKVGISKPESSQRDPKFSERNDINDDIRMRKHAENRPDHSCDGNERSSCHKDCKPLLKLKFKNPYFDNHCSWGRPREDEKSSIKGQRSKRKRPPPYMDKTPKQESVVQGKSMADIMDANWILKKLGTDAIGKRVEVHQQSDKSWHKGSVTHITEESTPRLSVELDDGMVKTFELGTQGIRFLSKKQKRSKTSKD